MSSRGKRDIDDLTLIKGIGEARQKILNQVLDIYSFSDLAAIGASSLQAAFKQRSEAVSLEMVTSWIEFATAATTTADDEAVIVESESWQAFATFVVEFQQSRGSRDLQRTNVHHMQADETSCWEGIQPDLSGDWIRQRVVQAADSTDEQASVGGAPDTASHTCALIRHFYLSAGDRVVSSDGAAVSGFMTGHTLGIDIGVGFEPPLSLGEQIVLNVKCLARDPGSGRVFNLLQQDVLQLPVSADDNRIHLEADSLPAGTYHVLVAISSHAKAVKPHFSEIHEVRVSD